MNDERLSWEDIKYRYPKQFVYLQDVEWSPENETTVVSAIVAHASEEPDEDYLNKTFQGEYTELYTAPGTTLQMGALML